MRFNTIIPLLLALLTGCGLAPDEDRHLEHVIPAHKPRSYAETVEQLDRRIQSLSDADSGSERITQLEELGDIIRWLPELAADSDLRKPHWEQARDVAVRMQLHFEQIAPEGSEESAAAYEALMNEITELRKLVPVSDDSPSRPLDER
jgi:hypothetical protein